jgi:hypothetical protein
MQAVQQYYNNVKAFFEQTKNEIKYIFSSPLFMDIYQAISIIAIFTNQWFWQFINKSIIIMNITYELCKHYIPIIYKFLYAFIQVLNNNYGDDDTNNVDINNIPSPKKPIIDTSWCNVDIKNIIPDRVVIIENNHVNENNEITTDDVSVNEVRQDVIVDDTVIDAAESDVASNDTKPEIEISEDKKNQ